MTYRTLQIKTGLTSSLEKQPLGFTDAISQSEKSNYCMLIIAFSVSKVTEDFIVSVSKSLDGKTFTLFIKHLNELRLEVLENPQHKLTPDSFLIFLDKLKNLTHSEPLNDMILRKLSHINI